MKIQSAVFRFAVVFLLLAGAVISGNANVLVWTNLAGGNWNVAANWSPNFIPGVSDDAYITNNGNYLVKLDFGASVSTFTLGGAVGTQTFYDSGYTFICNNSLTVNSNGVLNVDMSSARVFGNGPSSLAGKINWTNGILAFPSLNISTNGILTLGASPGSSNSISGYITNYGTMTVAGGNLVILGACTGFNLASLVNMPGGVVDIQADSAILNHCGNEAITNYGTIKKSLGAGATVIQPPLHNFGLLDAHSGGIILTNGGEIGGGLNADAGATLQLVGSYALDPGVTVSGAGTNLWENGTVTLNGVTLSTSNLVLSTATLSGSNATLSGSMVFPNGNLKCTNFYVAPSGQIDFSAGGTGHSFYGTLSNAGTLLFDCASVAEMTFDGSAERGGILINMPGGLIDISGVVNFRSGATGSEVFTNYGTIRADSTNNPAGVYMRFYNRGTLDFGVSHELTFEAPVDLTGGLVKVSIVDLSHAGNGIFLNSTAILGGTMEAGFAGNYRPRAGDSFSLVNFSIGEQISGYFTNTVLPSSDLWQTNYDLANGFFGVTVLQVYSPVLAPLNNYTINPGQTISFTASATDGDTNQTLYYCLDTNVTGHPLLTNAFINPANGAFSWRAPVSYAGTSNYATIFVSDNDSPPLTTSQTFAIIVNPLSGPVQLSPATASFSGGHFQMSVTGPTGPDYILMTSSNLASGAWTAVLTNTPSASPFTLADPNPISSAQFYRIELGPF